MRKLVVLLFAVMAGSSFAPAQTNLDYALECCWTGVGDLSSCYAYRRPVYDTVTGQVTYVDYDACFAGGDVCYSRYFTTYYGFGNGYMNCVPTSIGSFVLEDFVQKAVGGYCNDGEPNVAASIEVSGHQYAQCINGGGNVAPGRERVALTTTAKFQSDYCAHGKFHFSTSVADNREFTLGQVPISSSPKDLGCPNGNWDLVRVNGKVQAATDEAGNAYTDWNAMNIRVTRDNGGTVESRACCYTALEDAKPSTCEHEFCNVKGVPDATADGYRAGDLFCGVVWSSDRKCDEDTGDCPTGTVCGQGNLCVPAACTGNESCPDGSECVDGGCVPACS